VLGSVYRYAKECGLTEYNPCLGASRNPETPRDQEMHDEIFLELYEEASPVLQCLMDLDVMVGSRVSDLLKITEFDWTAAGLMAIPSKRKRGQVAKKQLFKRTPTSRRSSTGRSSSRSAPSRAIATCPATSR
jgi:integrase